MLIFQTVAGKYLLFKGVSAIVDCEGRRGNARSRAQKKEAHKAFKVKLSGYRRR